MGNNEKEILKFRVNTTGLLNEILENPGTSILRKPIKIFAELLFEVGEAAARINDAELNGLMCQLAIYEIAEPNNKTAYKPELVNQIIQTGLKLRKARKDAEPKDLTTLEKIEIAATESNAAYHNYQQKSAALLELKQKLAKESGYKIGALVEYKGKRGQITHYHGDLPEITFYKVDGTMGKRTQRVWNHDRHNVTFLKDV